MDRPEIDIVIPVPKTSKQLEKTVKLLDKYTDNYTLHVPIEPKLNVSEARAQAMSDVDGDYVCFLDYDSEMVHEGWLDSMFKTLVGNENAGAVFGSEWWGDEDQPEIGGHTESIEFGPAACMLLDKRRIPDSVKWDTRIGLRNGWLGGDFEEVDYCVQLRGKGLDCLRDYGAVFHHTGGKKTLMDFRETDRARTVRAMKVLLHYKYAKAPNDPDWFDGLKYVKARRGNDDMLAVGKTLKGCYQDVIKRNGLSYHPTLKRMGLV